MRKKTLYSTRFRWLVLPVLIGLAIVLRVVAPGSDPYMRLSWSSGLLTDEGFYLHNARNVALFGTCRTDDFNNALLMPTLHMVQVAVFRQFGAGIIQARAISIVASLLMLPVFFAALRRAFGLRVASVATLFLSFDHVMLLYNRMALMDTPATLLLVCAFYAWVRAFALPKKTALDSTSIFWLAVCGFGFGMAFATRGLCAFFVPVPIFLLTRSLRREGRSAGLRLVAFLLGLTGSLLLYGGLWYLPHRAELARLNAYYVRHQLLPQSFTHLLRIIGSFFFGAERGVSPFLALHTPALFALALAGIIWYVRHRRKAGGPLSLHTQFLAGWLLMAWLVFGTVGYAPSRYYVLFYPALTAIAALTWNRLEEIFPLLYTPVAIRLIFGSFFVYHFAMALRPADSPFGYAFVALLLAGFALFLRLVPLSPRFAAAVPRLALLLWILVNGFWLQDWWRHRSYTQRDAERWLVANLPPHSILLGDVAPGLSINTNFLAISVIPGLCNDRSPLERLGRGPCAIVILDGTAKERWWTAHYPALVAPERRTMLFPAVVGFPVGIYVVPQNWHDSPVR